MKNASVGRLDGLLLKGEKCANRTNKIAEVRTVSAGFTLIELLVVGLIIGILSAVALPQYNKVVEKSRMGEAQSIMASLKSNIELYLMSNGFPGTNINLLGNSSDTSVDMGVSLQHLKCQASSCSSKYFTYSAYCGTSPTSGEGVCYISAARKNEGYSTELYTLSQSRGPAKWDILRCFNHNKTDPGQVICREINGY